MSLFCGDVTIDLGQKQMTVSIGGFLPFQLGEITGKFNHPLEQVYIDDLDQNQDQDLEDHDDNLEDHDDDQVQDDDHDQNQDDDLEDQDDGVIAVSLHPGAHVHEADLHNTFGLSPALGARREGENVNVDI